jgi:hypothetical protein
VEDASTAVGVITAAVVVAAKGGATTGAEHAAAQSVR